MSDVTSPATPGPCPGGVWLCFDGFGPFFNWRGPRFGRRGTCGEWRGTWHGGRGPAQDGGGPPDLGTGPRLPSPGPPSRAPGPHHLPAGPGPPPVGVRDRAIGPRPPPVGVRDPAIGPPSSSDRARFSYARYWSSFHRRRSPRSWSSFRPVAAWRRSRRTPDSIARSLRIVLSSGLLTSTPGNPGTTHPQQSRPAPHDRRRSY